MLKPGAPHASLSGVSITINMLAAGDAEARCPHASLSGVSITINMLAAGDAEARCPPCLFEWGFYNNKIACCW